MATKRFVAIVLVQIGLVLWAGLRLDHEFRSAAASIPQQKEPLSGTRFKETLARTFQNPPVEYGPIDCWWWEAGHLNREKMRWQLEELKEKGVSGTWFYPRWVYGEPLSSDPRYWSEKWWDFTRFSLEEHRRLGLISWFSDWTSHQFHQNRVRAERERNPAFWGRRLVIYEKQSEGEGVIALEIPAQDEILEAAAYRQEGNALDYASRRVLTDAIRDRKVEWRAPGSGWLLTALTAQPYDLDYLNKVVANRWNEIFLGEYEKRLPEFVGNTLKAFGPDEMWLMMGNTLFSRSLPERVQSQRGYDISPYLIGLFYDIGPKTDQIRCDYYDTMSSLLEENFYRPISSWLEERKMQYTTIATWGRLDPLEQTFHYGDFFRYMRWFHVTGNEDPYRTKVGERRFIDSKLSSSVAHLYERQRVAMCVYWRSGWGVSQEENLAWTNENYAYGINLYNRHGGQYTLMGGWYEWVPPSDHFYHPYWRYWRTFTDYVRRLSYIMSQGKHRADVALLYPVTTIHANWLAGRVSGPLHRQDVWPAFEQAAVESSEKMKELAKAIYRDGIDFDFVDNSSLERAIVKGKILEVSGVEFRSVVLPPMSTIRTATLEKIKQFYDSGGTIVAYGRLPTASAERGRGDPRIRSLIEEIFPGIVGAEVHTVVSRENARGGRAFLVPGNAPRVPEVLSDAIPRDVVSTEKGLFHTHQKVDAFDIYYLFNAEERERVLTARFRVEGEPEIWDPFTGETRPIQRFKRLKEGTEVRLKINPHEGLVLVFSPESSRPAVVEDNILDLTVVEVQGTVTVRGVDEAGGRKRARVLYQGEEYAAETEVKPPPATIRLEGPFSFRLEPTMHNRWGDFRYPPSEATIGAEARRFRYLEESNVPGTDLGWQRGDFDDSAWPEVTYSYGPYWWHIGPFQEGSEPEELLEKTKQGEVDVGQAWNRWKSGDSSLRWKPYNFSKKFGYEQLEDDWGGLLGVSENFLVFGQAPAGRLNTHYLFTSVYAPEEKDYILYFGGKPEKADYRGRPYYQVPSRRQAWVNGEEVLSVTRSQRGWDVQELQRRGFLFEVGQALTQQEQDSPEIRTSVHLRQGWNSVLLKIVQPEGRPVATYAVFLESDPPPYNPYEPLLRWFKEPQRLVYDITPDKARRVGWYRFQAPPGLQVIRLQARARGIEAWIDGRSFPVQGDKISFQPPPSAASQVALRVEQEPGTYAGAVFPEPVAFDCAEGQIPLGDWTQFGLATYSGVGVYSKEIRVERAHLEGRVLLDLGQVKTVADVEVNGQRAGVKMARPFQFDITNLLREGQNRIEIKVANTLANHMSTYPTRWVLEGQTVSGLLGPVQLRFLSPVILTAKRVD